MRHLAVKHGEGVAPDEDGQYPCSVCGKSLSSWATALTGQDGRFSFEDLEDGTYELNVNDFGSGIRHEEEVEISGDTEVFIELRTGRVAGRVVDGYDLGPVEGATIGGPFTANGYAGDPARVLNRSRSQP